jgi:1,4-alpha-glucan branching enzyme/maltooligosyltrehalose trehalohydrolase
VHAIAEPGTPHVLDEISRTVGDLARSTERMIHLVLENDDNRASLLDPDTTVPSGQYRAQWNDDYHHAWHVLLSGETRGYYVDYADDPRRDIARALSSGFVYQGDRSPHRQGAVRGEPSGSLPPRAFVNFLQNHDQIGNRAFGDRLTTLTKPEAIAAALAVTLLAPPAPLLFMGEEWGATQPFPFFCDFAGDLGEAVRRGRRAEFEAQFADLGDAAEVPDPLAETTFNSAVLDWEARAREPYASRLKLVADLLAARRRFIIPELPLLEAGKTQAAFAGPVLTARWTAKGATAFTLIANLGDAAIDTPPGIGVGTVIWGGELPRNLSPWSVYWIAGER